MTAIPANLIEEIARGRVVLVLGAGAWAGASIPGKSRVPLGNDLRDALCDRFLGGTKKDEQLDYVADLAISESDLASVQDFIASEFDGIRPAQHHLELTTFKWRGIATTNFDRLLETAYQEASSHQSLVPIRSDADRIDELLRGPHTLAYLKLHGCVTRTHDPDLPMILTMDQYVQHRRNREGLFLALKTWAEEHPVVFIGHRGRDPDLRSLLLEVSDDTQLRPRFYVVRPGVDDMEKRFWETKKTTVLDMTFEAFVRELSQRIPESSRELLSTVELDSPLRRRFVVNEEISSTLAEFLAQDVEYVHPSMPMGHGNPHGFYRGFDLGWYGVVNQLDVRRTLGRQLLEDVILLGESERPTSADFYVVLAEAGAGKSILLRRLAWEAGVDADCLCLYLRPTGMLRYEGLQEVFRVTQQRIFLFVDPVAAHPAELQEVLVRARRDQLPLTVVAASRSNAWHGVADRLSPLLTGEFELRYLSRAEITTLVELLATHDELGPHLTGRSKEECVHQFEERAGRQLLVALHEATSGRPFEDILMDEYREISPLAAQQMYLTICTLNRLNVPVRAGVIARVHGIPFADFRDRLFSPLQDVVQASQHPGTQDYLYETRHPEIAQIVFQHVLDDPRERLNEYLRVIAALNPSYSTDRAALRGLLRAKSINELFPDFQDAKAIFEAALRTAPREAYLYQQRANYERVRRDGNMGVAEGLLEEARKLDPRDSSVLHTLAEVKKARADSSDTRLERVRWRNEARGILQPLIAQRQHDQFAWHTLAKIAIDELKDLLSASESTEREIDEGVRRSEGVLQRALQLYPDEPFLLMAEAEYSALLENNARSFNAMQRAFEANKKDAFIASRLAKVLEQRGEVDAARSTLEAALAGNRGDMRLNFQYAELLRRHGPSDSATLIYHYKRSFTKGDANYDAQFWFARFAFEGNDPADLEAAKATFRALRAAPLPFRLRSAKKDMLRDGDEPRIFRGEVARMESSHGFIARDGDGLWIFCHRNDLGEDVWTQLTRGMRVAFEIGMTFSGPVALSVRLA